MSRLMVCDDCWKLWGEPREIKTMGSGGPCCVCGARVSCGGPIAENERNELKLRLAMSKEAPINTNVKPGEWFKLNKGNDWGADYLARDPFDRSPCIVQEGMTGPKRPGFYKTARGGRAYRLAEGEPLVVRLQNGGIRAGIVRERLSDTEVQDMGHSYRVTSKEHYVAFDDGTEASLLNVELRYEPERDPTAAEVI